MNIYKLVFLLLCLGSFACNQPEASSKDSAQSKKNNKPAVPLAIFRSGDDGQTWQDISKELPENLREDSTRRNNIFANDKGLFLRAGNELYHSAPNATAPFWAKEVFPGEDSSITPGKPGIFYWGVNLKTTNGTSVWSPVFENFQEPRIRSTFETAGGTIFIGIDRGIFRSTDQGKTWKLVYAGGYVGHLAESNGVLLAIGMKRIIRSTDDGENWAPVISEDTVAFDVKPFRDGFVAMTSSSVSNPRGLLISHDNGKTWQSIYSGLQDKAVIDSIWRTWNDRPRLQAFQTSITRVGENFFCTHPAGIFRSSDKGKTWKLLLSSVDDKGFYLFVSGNLIYAIKPKVKGC